nr:TetR/AcrR family transcriptional regulator [Naumannella cuiyingiana]
MRAVEDELIEHGLAGIQLGRVARRAGVGRSTVYRRWGGGAALVADLLESMAATSLPRARTGSLAGDLAANARLVGRTLADPRQGALFRAVISAAEVDRAAARALSTFYAIRIAEWAPCVTEAVERGEVPAGTDPEEVFRAVSAPLYHRLITGLGTIDRAAADRAAATALAAARAGVFVSDAETRDESE